MNITEQLEKELEKKSRRRKRKRTHKPKMKVDGKNVFRLQTIIAKKPRIDKKRKAR